MGARILADAVLLAHFAFVLFAVFGGLAALRWRRAPWLHVPVVAWASLVNLAGWTCPLTPLENALRRAAGEAGYPGGFVAHYVAALVYPGGMTRDLELVAGVSVLVWNAIVYTAVLRRRRRG